MNNRYRVTEKSLNVFEAVLNGATLAATGIAYGVSAVRAGEICHNIMYNIMTIGFSDVGYAYDSYVKLSMVREDSVFWLEQLRLYRKYLIENPLPDNNARDIRVMIFSC